MKFFVIPMASVVSAFMLPTLAIIAQNWRDWITFNPLLIIMGFFTLIIAGGGFAFYVSWGIASEWEFKN